MTDVDDQRTEQVDHIASRSIRSAEPTIELTEDASFARLRWPIALSSVLSVTVAFTDSAGARRARGPPDQRVRRAARSSLFGVVRRQPLPRDPRADRRHLRAELPQHAGPRADDDQLGCRPPRPTSSAPTATPTSRPRPPTPGPDSAPPRRRSARRAGRSAAIVGLINTAVRTLVYVGDRSRHLLAGVADRHRRRRRVDGRAPPDQSADPSMHQRDVPALHRRRRGDRRDGDLGPGAALPEPLGRDSRGSSPPRSAASSG